MRLRLDSIELDRLPVPGAVKELVDLRLATLSDDERTLLEGGALLGFEFDPELVAAALDRESVPVADGELRVRLAFGAAADLDLYVTDPLQETVYFANTPTQAGGRLERDQRCDSAPPRVETVRFPLARAGVYRIGIDFPKRCDGAEEAAAFVLRVEREGASEERRGGIAPLHFLAIVHETSVPE